MINKSYQLRIIILVCILILSACSVERVDPTSEALPVETAEATVTPTTAPSPTPTTLVERVLFISAPGSDATQTNGIRAAVERLSNEHGLQLDVGEGLESNQLEADVRVVVMLGTPDGMAEAVDASPETQFILIGGADSSQAPNLSIIGVDESRPDQQGFLAGIIAAVITEDWRVGVIGADRGGSRAAVQAFIQGVKFFCGLCRPAYPPYPGYPLSVVLPEGSSPEEWRAAAAVLTSEENAVEVLYVAPGAGDIDFLSFLVEAGVNVIGSQPPVESMGSRWVAGVVEDVVQALEEVFTAALAGEGGLFRTTALQIFSPNEQLFSLARQRVVEDYLQELASGQIDTGVDPETGNLR